MARLSLLFVCFAGFPTLALAHAGHWVDVAGHAHLLAGAAIGIAIAIGVAGALKGRRGEDEGDDEAEADPELSEA